MADSAHAAPEPMPEYQTIVLRNRLADGLLAGRGIARTRHPAGVSAKRRWFALKDQTLRAVRLTSLAALPQSEQRVLLAEIETETPARHGALAAAARRSPGRIARPAALPTQLALARVRRGARVGLLTDGFALPELRPRS